MRHSNVLPSRLLTQVMTVYRRAAGSTRFGQPAASFSIYLDFVPCRRTIKRGSEEVSDLSRGAVTETITVYCDPGIDVREDDRISIRDHHGYVDVALADVTHVSKPLGRWGEAHHTEISARIRREGTDAP